MSVNSNFVYFGGVAGYAKSNTFNGKKDEMDDENCTVKMYYEIDIRCISSSYPTVNIGGIFGTMNECSVSNVPFQ